MVFAELEIVVPTFLVDTQKCRKNIVRMQAKAQQHQLAFRPHFKTHQSEKIGFLFRDLGITQITVSSFRMAQYFAQQGWRNITVAFPVNILEIEAINKLAKQLKLHVLVESTETVELLNSHLQYMVGAYVKIDNGYHRTGMDVVHIEKISTVVEAIEQSCFLNFAGFLSHAGNTYQAKNKQEIAKIHLNNIKQMNLLKNTFLGKYPEMKLSIGDTPSCSLMERFEGIDEIRPGNFVYYDAMQLLIGSCQLEQIAAFVACPVVAVHPERNELVIYGGAVHFSKESMDHHAYGICFGLVVEELVKGLQLMDGCYLKKISQEHGVVHVTKEFLAHKPVGSIIYLIPVHSCLTANLMKEDTLYLE